MIVGNRRWRKDIANAVWTWYPCGVACGAGELVEETSDLTGGSWTTSAHYLRAGGGCSSLLIRRNSEYHCFDLTGTVGVILDGGSSLLSDNLYDAYGVDMYSSGNAVTPYRVPQGKLDEDGLVSPMCVKLPIRDLALIKGCGDLGKLLCRFCYDYCWLFKRTLHLKKGETCKDWCHIKYGCPDGKKKSPGGPCGPGQITVVITCGSAKATVCLDPGESACCSGNGVMVVKGPCPPSKAPGN